jgi:hypothetical protein
MYYLVLSRAAAAERGKVRTQCRCFISECVCVWRVLCRELSSSSCTSLDGWTDGWVGGWVGGRADLREYQQATALLLGGTRAQRVVQ